MIEDAAIYFDALVTSEREKAIGQAAAIVRQHFVDPEIREGRQRRVY